MEGRFERCGGALRRNMSEKCLNSGAETHPRQRRDAADDATEENAIMYDAFNEELEGMFRDVTTLPLEEAWTYPGRP